MNIFLLDVNPRLAAQAHYDKHVVKMILEYAQLLSTCHAELGSPVAHELYKPTHRNHPCAIWVRQSLGNYTWLWQLLKDLCHEYTYRFGRVHATERLLVPLIQAPPMLRTRDGMTPFPQVVPDEYRCSNTVEAYRRLYLGDKLYLAKYTKRTPPAWHTSLITGAKA